jgi:hypothetical protein
MSAANSNLRCSASEAPWGVSSIDFDGRPTDWSAVAFGDDLEALSMPIEQRIWCLATLVLLSIPYVFIGAAAAWLVGA